MGGRDLKIAVALLSAGALAWWWLRAPQGVVTVEEIPNSEFNVGDFPLVAPVIDSLEQMGFPVGTPRGIRNNNPGNIRFNALIKWQGQVGSDGAFVIFDRPENGIRAMGRILNSYAARGVDTVREVITTWAPPVENNTTSYISAVARACGVGADQVPNRLLLVKAIIRHENGQQPYSDFQLQTGIAAA